MKKGIKQSLFISSILSGCLAIGVAATLGSFGTINQARAGSYSLILNSSKAPSSLTDSYQDNLTATVTTNDGNSISLCFVYAKASSGNFVQLANRGYLHNFGSESGRFTGITGITLTMERKLKLICMPLTAQKYLSSKSKWSKVGTSSSQVIIEEVRQLLILKSSIHHILETL